MCALADAMIASIDVWLALPDVRLAANANPTANPLSAKPNGDSSTHASKVVCVASVSEITRREPSTKHEPTYGSTLRRVAPVLFMAALRPWRTIRILQYRPLCNTWHHLRTVLRLVHLALCNRCKPALRIMRNRNNRCKPALRIMRNRNNRCIIKLLAALALYSPCNPPITNKPAVLIHSKPAISIHIPLRIVVHRAKRRRTTVQLLRQEQCMEVPVLPPVCRRSSTSRMRLLRHSH
jgi:hypothetical protein